ncbi:hypothetical protein [Rummeliibacillus stabekisii]|uniref:hypothetical protein n=1 Tax=Rummeliibacillus stabekisii TaxID=241244 RepID=UPI0037154771
MDLKIMRTHENEVPKLLEIQKESFAEDLKRYKDQDSNPVNEPMERLLRKTQVFLHYTIWLNGEIIGGIDIRDLNNNRYRLNRIFYPTINKIKAMALALWNLLNPNFL